jgi:single-strand DNA-binding protein
MANLNRVLIIGNCTRDPELRYTVKGTPWCEISVAVKRAWKNGRR